MKEIDRSEITPEHVFMNRRRFMAGVGAVIAGSILGGCGQGGPQPEATVAPPATPAGAGEETDPLLSEITPYDSIIGYNNFYEFSLSKEAVRPAAEDFQTTGWKVEVGGLVANPQTFSMEDLLRFDQEERVYRLRCVEAWSMVIPWNGFPLWKLLDQVVPAPEAQYVRFETLLDPERMPGQRFPSLDWPYMEGLRLDEARHDLTLLATGIYGKPLTPQNGAPIRLVVPWKYGFKNIKSIVRIDLVAEQPVSSWTAAAPHEYGFYANVNPQVTHPRWSQASERVIGEGGRKATLLFNGYEEEVAHLYEGMDLKEYY